ncbi:MAG: DUF3593 domain-containing protein [Gloeomargarita sp. SKYBB_i_bin120]|nr:DUF3593 domain-containing protein [Gloeomargarita sp. SKYB120]MDW8178514.1 DUF3593 domain-containing protein [Gloeomargarita sp. SKYBB_i_bin120]
MTENLLFALSLFPYLGFLWCLHRAKAPRGILVGFGLTLLFVAISIPAGVAAQRWYGRSLADVDWLHGGAEFWLTVANASLVLGLRRALRQKAETT